MLKKGKTVTLRDGKDLEGEHFEQIISHNADAELYSKLKNRLAETHTSDREMYTDAKADFVMDIVKKAKKENF